MVIKEIFAERLKQLREQKRLSQTDLAEKLGVSRGSISFYENQERVPDIEFLVKTAEFFNVPIDYLLGRTNSKMEIKPEIENLGLSDEAVKVFLLMNGNALGVFENGSCDEFKHMLHIANHLIVSEEFNRAMVGFSISIYLKQSLKNLDKYITSDDNNTQYDIVTAKNIINSRNPDHINEMSELYGYKAVDALYEAGKLIMANWEMIIKDIQSNK